MSFKNFFFPPIGIIAYMAVTLIVRDQIVARNMQLRSYKDLEYSQALQVLEEEKRKIKLSGIEVELIYYGYMGGIFPAIGTCSRPESCKIIICPEYRNRKTIRHELYHIRKLVDNDNWGSGQNLMNPLDLVEEWQATSYALRED